MIFLKRLHILIFIFYTIPVPASENSRLIVTVSQSEERICSLKVYDIASFLRYGGDWRVLTKEDLNNNISLCQDEIPLSKDNILHCLTYIKNDANKFIALLDKNIDKVNYSSFLLQHNDEYEMPLFYAMKNNAHDAVAMLLSMSNKNKIIYNINRAHENIVLDYVWNASLTRPLDYLKNGLTVISLSCPNSLKVFEKITFFAQRALQREDYPVFDLFIKFYPYCVMLKTLDNRSALESVIASKNPLFNQKMNYDEKMKYLKSFLNSVEDKNFLENEYECLMGKIKTNIVRVTSSEVLERGEVVLDCNKKDLSGKINFLIDVSRQISIRINMLI